MKVAVLGAGVVGVSTAWFLAQAGHEVLVLERASGPARETSFANGGQISVSQSEPWAYPGAPWQILRWLARADSPLLFSLRLDPGQWRWIVSFLRECWPGRFERNMRQMLALGRYSRATFDELRSQLGISFHDKACGIVTLLKTRKQLEQQHKTCSVMQSLGIDKRLITPTQLLALEPALAPVVSTLAGATWCPSDASGDVHQFTCQLAQHASQIGVTFRFNTRVNALNRQAEQISGISVTEADGRYATLQADAYVLALGSYSPLLAKTAGLHLPIYPAKGYSATVPVRTEASAPTISITDESRKIVVSRLGGMLRIAGTAELAGYSLHLNQLRCQALLRHAKTLFAMDSCAWDEAEFWTGLRPSTPSNVPLIGQSRLENLYLNTGHGTLGFTEGPGSGRALAELMSGRAAPIDFSFLKG